MKRFRLHYLIGHSVETVIINAPTEQEAIEFLRCFGYVFVTKAEQLPPKKKRKKKKKKQLPQ